MALNFERGRRYSLEAHIGHIYCHDAVVAQVFRHKNFTSGIMGNAAFRAHRYIKWADAHRKIAGQLIALGLHPLR